MSERLTLEVAAKAIGQESIDRLSESLNRFSGRIRRRRIRLLLQIETQARRFLAGLEPDPSIVLQAALVIAHQHIAWKTPLHLDDGLYDRWASAEHSGAVECIACGYRMPQGTASCVLCNVEVGDPGIFRKNRERRARLAGMN